jgi:hypothetical protein
VMDLLERSSLLEELRMDDLEAVIHKPATP